MAGMIWKSQVHFLRIKFRQHNLKTLVVMKNWYGTFDNQTPVDGA